MRTLVDLFSDEHGYLRIFAEREGYSYEISTYLARPAADLFERMSGYASVDAAREAARFQLSSTGRVKLVRARRPRRGTSQSEMYRSQPLPLVWC